ncbi:DUF1223 domain-containing protein [Aureimonas flava]|uniref:DUF1223 domain-containing protein n=1 Tax=Aureimonas flava TaxID=2320271 RepID=UPI00145A00FC|nr:DUF1223 domain-containing protein [Aureimonas flava]
MTSRRSVALGFLSLAGLALAAAPPALAGDRSVSSRDVRGVLELFTSQSCRECRPAGAVVGRLGTAPDIVVLAYHVDYWDYTGWRDKLADRRNTARQKAYAKRLKLGALVTPQVVVNGRQALGGADERALAQAMAETPLGSAQAAGEIRMRTQGDALHIRASATGGEAGRSPPILVLVTYSERVETVVPGAMPAGRTLIDHFPVRDWRILGSVDGAPIELEMPLSLLVGDGDGRTGLAALLQAVGADNKPGPILAAAALEF